VLNLQYFNNNLYMFGFSQDSLTIGNIKFLNKNYSSQILSCWDTNGNIKWAKQLGGPLNNYSGKMSHDNLGNIYLTGSFNGTSAIFDSVTIFSSADNEGYVAKYDLTGKRIWLKQISVSNNIKFYGVNSDGNGDFYFTGSISGNAKFGNYSIKANTNEDIFLARYNSTGDCLGVSYIGEGLGFDVLTDINGSAYVCGSFKNSINFSTTNLTSYGYNDAFIAKHDAITGIVIEPKMAGNQLLIYANPTTGKCNITIPDEFQQENNLILNIFNNTGQLIQEIGVKMNENVINFNLQAEVKGIYIATLRNGSKIYYGKILFE
jgi:hypothetical protein